MKRSTSQLLALSFDTPASPWLTLLEGPPGEPRTAGWGVAWYPADDAAAVVIKDPRSTRDMSFAELIGEWDRFRSTCFVGHIRGAAKRRTQQDTHPFLRSYARRNFVFAHVGDLTGDYRAGLPLGERPVFDPLGCTDSEHVLCWLLTRIRECGARTLAEVGWPVLLGFFEEIDALGTANMILSDGLDIVAYRDFDGHSSLHWQRRVPPFQSRIFGNDYVQVNVSDPLDHSRSMLVITTTPFQGEGWTVMDPGEMLVVRRAAVHWRNRQTAPVATESGCSDGQAPVAIADPALAAGRGERVPDATGPRSCAPAAAAAGSAPAPEPVPEGGHENESVLSAFHETVYTYHLPVDHSVQTLRLHPVHDAVQEVLDLELTITPSGPSKVYDDVFGNCVMEVELKEPYQELRIVSQALVRIRPRLDATWAGHRETIPLVWMPWQRQMMSPYLLPSELPESHLRELSEYAMSFVERQDYDLIESLRDLNQTIYRDYQYLSGSTTLETTPFDVFVARRGVCQDFANLFICLARLLGIPARYRVGYIHTGADYANKIQSEASHAWAEVYLPQIGWRGFDPTNGCMTGVHHIRVAVGRNYRDATPTSGTIYRGGQGETLSVTVRVEPR